MMGKAQSTQPKLFYTDFSLERRIAADHPLRRIKELVDFGFVRREVAERYGTRGNPSVDPAVILKLMFLLFHENVNSERALMSQLPVRLDWLWFCGYDLDARTPNHSVLSKARRRWGLEVFAGFFERILQQCIDAGLVDGEVVHIDSSMIDGDLSKDTLRPQLRQMAESLYAGLEDQCERPSPGRDGDDEQDDPPLERRVSAVDPDARLAKKYGRSTLGYKDHRVIDDRCGIVTATVTTAANVNDSDMMIQSLWRHEANTRTPGRTVVADRGYGVIDNYRYLHERGIEACIPHQRRARKQGKFGYEQFTYDKSRDGYICPAGATLHKTHEGISTRAYSYRCPRATCEACAYFKDCVTSEVHGRLVTRNIEADEVEWADGCLSRAQRRRLLHRRRYKAEGSYADAANNHGFKRARWRGLVWMQVQNLMIAAVQNLRKLLRHRHGPAGGAASALMMAMVERFGVWRATATSKTYWNTC